VKLKTLISTGLVLGMAGIASAAFTGSFLSTGTSGLFKNEADLAVGEGTFTGFGYYATMSDRISIYTNLMNAQGGNDQFFGNSSNNQYLMGMSGNLLRFIDKLNTSLIVELNNNTTPRSITGKIDGTTGTGSLSLEQITRDDNSGTTETEKETNINEYETHANSIVINNTVILSEKMTLGLLFYRASNNGTDTRAALAPLNVLNGYFPFAAGTSPSFTYNYVNGLTTINERGDFELNRTSPVTRIFAGARFGLGEMALDAYAGAELSGTTGDTAVEYDFYEKNMTVETTEKEKQLAEGTSSANRIALGGRLSNGFLGGRITTATALEFGIVTGAMESKNDALYSFIENTSAALLTEHYTENVAEKFEWKDGDVSGMTASLAISAKLAIDPSLHLGLGFGYAWSSSTTEYKLTHDYTYVETYNDGDSYTNDADDYTLTTIDGFMGRKATRDYTLGRFTLPVGLTWDMNAKWQLRASASHQIYVSRYLVGMDESGANTSSTVTTYGDGTVIRANGTATPQTATSYLYGSPSNQVNSYTAFAYGISYKPLTNFTIDCNAMFRSYAGNDGQDLFMLDLDWYRSLYLSATFFFDAAPKTAVNN
jgi:hypothetical protein